MAITQERDWRGIFQVQQVEKPFNLPTEAGDCNANCLEAKELKCTCKCHGRNHGAALKKNVKSLDTFEDPAEASFSPEEHLEELAVLA
jgi:hypothetical protein